MAASDSHEPELADWRGSFNHAVDELIQAIEGVEDQGDVAAHLESWCGALHELGKPDLAVVMRRLTVVLMRCMEGRLVRALAEAGAAEGAE
jgi:hypothetical protein